MQYCHAPRSCVQTTCPTPPYALFFCFLRLLENGSEVLVGMQHLWAASLTMLKCNHRYVHAKLFVSFIHSSADTCYRSAVSEDCVWPWRQMQGYPRSSAALKKLPISCQRHLINPRAAMEGCPEGHYTTAARRGFSLADRARLIHSASLSMSSSSSSESQRNYIPCQPRSYQKDKAC